MRRVAREKQNRGVAGAGRQERVAHGKFDPEGIAFEAWVGEVPQRGVGEVGFGVGVDTMVRVKLGVCMARSTRRQGEKGARGQKGGLWGRGEGEYCESFDKA